MDLNEATGTRNPGFPSPDAARAVVVGGGTMGADIATVLLRAGCQATVVEPLEARREVLPAHVAAGMAARGLVDGAGTLTVVPALGAVEWASVDLIIECIVESLDAKQALFADLVDRARADTLICSNSSSFPISAIGQGLRTPARLLGLHFFMPAHLEPLVEVVMGPDSGDAEATSLQAFMRGCGMMPVLVRKDLPGFLANRLQHALAREAFALLRDGVASAEDIDVAVRFGFGFRFLAAGPIMQRDHAGLDVHAAAAATMYPSLCADTEPSSALSERVAAGQFGMKTGAGFYTWSPEAKAAERLRYDRLLLAGLKLLAAELPTVGRQADSDGQSAA